MYYIIERIQKIYEEVGRYVYSDSMNIENYKYIDGNYHNIDLINNAPENEWKEFKTGDTWGGRDCHGWFKSSVEVPEKYSGKTIALSFHTFQGGWDATNPQFILYVNGEHIQGLDMNHREVILSHNAIAGTKYDIDLHAYAGMDDRKGTLYGKLIVIDEEARDLYFNLRVPTDVCKELDADDKRRLDMLTVLNEAVNLIDLRRPFSTEYYESLKTANRFLNEEFYDKLCGHEDVVATCVGHTHIDVAWLWTVAQTREKVARSFSTVLKLMEEYPEYIFMSSQPQLYKFLKEDHPKVYEKVKEKVREGVWEPEGAMWLEADCNVTSGESLVRQVLYGKQFFKKEFNVDNEVLWLPDVFGYSAALPQILKKSDVNYFMTTKIAWNQFNKMPYDTFMWRGIDGTEILTHFITTTEVGQARDNHRTTYNGTITPDTIMGAWRRYQQKDLGNDVLVSFGWGDGGGGATYAMLETGRRMAKGIPGAPKVKMGTSLDYFKNLENNIQDNKRLPKWVGELYLEYHRGTYTSMARNKRDNRICEMLYTSGEKVNSMAMILGKNYPHKNITDSWETILLNQFHDILPGSSIKEVYDVTDEEYKGLIANGKEVLNDGLDFISSKINLKERSAVVFNTLGFERSDIVTFDIPDDISNPIIIDTVTGEALKCQRVSDNKAIFFAKGVPANGHKSFKILEDKDNSHETVKLNENTGENKFFKIKFDNKGQITSLIHKETNREILKNGAIGNELQAFEDKPMCFGNWDIDIYYKEKMWTIDDVQSMEVIEKGPVRSTLRIERNFLESKIIQKIYIYNDISRIDFDSYIDWKEHDILIKAAFPIDINTNEATYEIQYGNVTRPTHKNTTWDIARFEVCGQKWADLSEDNFGVSLLNNCKYGHDILDGNMRLTLLKSGTDPNPVTDQEEHFFTYSIYPHSGDWKEAKTTQKAYELNSPMNVKIEESHPGILESELSFVKVDKDNIIIEVIKKAEDSDHLIVRMYEFHNKRINATLEFAFDIVEAKECNLMERDLETLNIDGKKLNFTIKPYEIKTFKVMLK